MSRRTARRSHQMTRGTVTSIPFQNVYPWASITWSWTIRCSLLPRTSTRGMGWTSKCDLLTRKLSKVFVINQGNNVHSTPYNAPVTTSRTSAWSCFYESCSEHKTTWTRSSCAAVSSSVPPYPPGQLPSASATSRHVNKSLPQWREPCRCPCRREKPSTPFCCESHRREPS